MVFGGHAHREKTPIRTAPMDPGWWIVTTAISTRGPSFFKFLHWGQLFNISDRPRAHVEGCDLVSLLVWSLQALGIVYSTSNEREAHSALYTLENVHKWEYPASGSSLYRTPSGKWMQRLRLGGRFPHYWLGKGNLLLWSSVDQFQVFVERRSANLRLAPLVVAQSSTEYMSYIYFFSVL